MEQQTQTELEAAAFRRLVQHLRERTDVQNIDLMNLAGFCRNCLSRWYREAAEERHIPLSDPEARELESVASALGMDVLIEVHDEPELHRALALRSPLIGINNRNLKTLQVDIATTEMLSRDLPQDRLLVSESGLSTATDLARMARAGARCFLIGESLMRQNDVAAATRALLAPTPVGAWA